MACHVLAVPYPGRGHVNPMMNLCKILASLMAPHDQELQWAVPLANRWKIPAAILWTSSASVFSMFLHFHLLPQNEHLGINLSEHEEERVEDIPGVSSTRISDLPTIFHGNDNNVLQLALQCISRVKQAQYLLINSIYELEPQVIDILKGMYSFPVQSIGPVIPFLDMNSNNHHTDGQDPNYIEWLDSQPIGSVLYISLGSFLSVSRQQVQEIVAGVRESGVRFLCVARGDNIWKRDFGTRGLVVSWCEQLRVLCHSSVGGFLSHCGWNSVLEATFAGVPILTFPIHFDQTPNSKQIVEVWKVGWRGRERLGVDNIVTREKISMLVGRFMDSESSERDELRRRAKQVQEVCRRAIAEGGTSVNDLKAFIKDVLQRKGLIAETNQFKELFCVDQSKEANITCNGMP